MALIAPALLSWNVPVGSGRLAGASCRVAPEATLGAVQRDRQTCTRRPNPELGCAATATPRAVQIRHGKKKRRDCTTARQAKVQAHRMVVALLGAAAAVDVGPPPSQPQASPRLDRANPPGCAGISRINYSPALASRAPPLGLITLA